MNGEWYRQIGPELLTNVLVLALYPVISLIFEALLLKIKRSFKKLAYASHNNNGTDNQKYLELKAGPEYFI